MQEAFGGINYVDRPNIGTCRVCDSGIFYDEDMTVDQIKSNIFNAQIINMHYKKTCFILEQLLGQAKFICWATP